LHLSVVGQLILSDKSQFPGPKSLAKVPSRGYVSTGLNAYYVIKLAIACWLALGSGALLAQDLSAFATDTEPKDGAWVEVQNQLRKFFHPNNQWGEDELKNNAEEIIVYITSSFSNVDLAQEKIETFILELRTENVAVTPEGFFEDRYHKFFETFDEVIKSVNKKRARADQSWRSTVWVAAPSAGVIAGALWMVWKKGLASKPWKPILRAGAIGAACGAGFAAIATFSVPSPAPISVKLPKQLPPVAAIMDADLSKNQKQQP